MVSGLEQVEIWNLTDNETNKLCVSLGHKSAKYKDIEWQPPHPPTSTTIKAVGEKNKIYSLLINDLPEHTAVANSTSHNLHAII